jgi:hypothetical protein
VKADYLTRAPARRAEANRAVLRAGLRAAFAPQLTAGAGRRDNETNRRLNKHRKRKTANRLTQQCYEKTTIETERAQQQEREKERQREPSRGSGEAKGKGRRRGRARATEQEEATNEASRELVRS